MRNYKQIIFDIDGTLINTEYAIIRSLIKTMEEITGNTYQYEDLKFALGITGKDALALLKIPDIEEGVKMWNANMELYHYTIQPFEGIRECLDFLLLNNHTLGIVTSKTYMEYYSDFEPFGLANYFTTVVCADDTVEHKPHAAPLLTYLAKANINSNDAIYIGDSIYDIQCAKAANMTSGLAMWGNTFNTDSKADYYLQTPDDICRIISKCELIN